jgi:hypothetical protein
MKRYLPLSLCIAFLCFSFIAKAQPCQVGNVVVSNNTVLQSGTNSCQVSVDLTFTILQNPGNKFIFIHAWLAQDYPNYFQCGNGTNTNTAPTGINLADAFLNIGIDNFGTAPVIIGAYPPDNNVPLTTGMTLETEELSSGGQQLVQVTLKNIVTTLPVACSETFDVKIDVWSSQHPQAQTVGCVNCDITVPVVPLSINGSANCLTLQYTAALVNEGNPTINGDYIVYVDINNNGIFDEGTDGLVTGPTDIQVQGNSTVNVTGAIPSQFGGENLVVELTSTNNFLYRDILPSGSCIPLPVTFKSFTAERQSQTVNLKWETAMEESNKGFQVQRNTGSGWSNLAFVDTKAENGNSSVILSYAFTDVNAFQGITQYRIQQVDFNGKTMYSEVRSVHGEQQSARTVIYPNPSNNGKFNIVFDNASVKDVIVSDMNGRILKQWNGLTNNLQVNSLQPGVYTLRIIDVQSGLQTTEKIIVNKR